MLLAYKIGYILQIFVEIYDNGELLVPKCEKLGSMVRVSRIILGSVTVSC